jgi:hypothetical protein
MSDTSAAARAVQASLRPSPQAAPDRWLDELSALCDDMRDVVRSGVRHRFPDADAAEIEREVRRILVGDELSKRAWPR